MQPINYLGRVVIISRAIAFVQGMLHTQSYPLSKITKTLCFQTSESTKSVQTKRLPKPKFTMPPRKANFSVRTFAEQGLERQRRDLRLKAPDYCGNPNLPVSFQNVPHVPNYGFFPTIPGPQPVLPDLSVSFKYPLSNVSRSLQAQPGHPPQPNYPSIPAYRAQVLGQPNTLVQESVQVLLHRPRGC